MSRSTRSRSTSPIESHEEHRTPSQQVRKLSFHGYQPTIHDSKTTVGRGNEDTLKAAKLTASDHGEVIELSCVRKNPSKNELNILQYLHEKYQNNSSVELGFLKPVLFSGDSIYLSRCAITLDEIVDRVQQLDQKNPAESMLRVQIAADIYIALIRAITHLKKADVIHCDIKKGNVGLHVDRHGNFSHVLFDFGIAQKKEMHTTQLDSSSVFKTASHYAAPEQTSIEEITPDLRYQCDVWGVGKILAELFFYPPTTEFFDIDSDCESESESELESSNDAMYLHQKKFSQAVGCAFILRAEIEEEYEAAKKKFNPKNSVNIYKAMKQKIALCKTAIDYFIFLKNNLCASLPQKRPTLSMLQYIAHRLEKLVFSDPGEEKLLANFYRDLSKQTQLHYQRRVKFVLPEKTAIKKANPKTAKPHYQNNRFFCLEKHTMRQSQRIKDRKFRSS